MISIVIPVFNSGALVEETLDSVLRQSYQDFEVIFVNDGSTDDTAAILNNLGKRDPRIKIVHQENGKQGKARNNGIKHANGEWIAFLDADDLWPRNKLELQLQKTLNTPHELSFTDGYICLNNDMNLLDYRFGVMETTYYGKSGIRAFHTQNRIPTSSVLVKKEALIRAGGFPENLSVQNCEDYLLWVKLLEQGSSFLSIGEALLYYRVHPSSSTFQETKALFPVIEALLKMNALETGELKTHLSEKFRQLMFRLDELDELSKANSIAPRVIPRLYSGFNKFLLLVTWNISPAIFIRIFWRINGGRIKN